MHEPASLVNTAHEMGSSESTFRTEIFQSLDNWAVTNYLLKKVPQYGSFTGISNDGTQIAMGSILICSPAWTGGLLTWLEVPPLLHCDTATLMLKGTAPQCTAAQCPVPTRLVSIFSSHTCKCQSRGKARQLLR